MSHFHFLDSFDGYKVLLTLNENRSKESSSYLFHISLCEKTLAVPVLSFRFSHKLGKTAHIKGMEARAGILEVWSTDHLHRTT